MGEIIYKIGNVLRAEEQIIAHGCNTLGVMGAGVAEGVRLGYPEAFTLYRESTRTLGQVIPALSRGKIILNLITQDQIGGPGRNVSYDAVDDCFQLLDLCFAGHDIAMPKIGAGLGGGDWNVIAAIIEHRANNFQPIVYEL